MSSENFVSESNTHVSNETSSNNWVTWNSNLWRSLETKFFQDVQISHSFAANIIHSKSITCLCYRLNCFGIVSGCYFKSSEKKKHFLHFDLDNYAILMKINIHGNIVNLHKLIISWNSIESIEMNLFHVSYRCGNVHQNLCG